MAQNPNNLPYFKIKSTVEEKTLANFLLRKFRPQIRKKFPQHYLVQPIPYKTLKFVKDNVKKYPYFLKLDIKELDSFIRNRLRRYIYRNKDSQDRKGNLILTNASLKSLGLKSLKEIYQKYWSKKQYKFRKKSKTKAKTGKSIKRPPGLDYEKIEAKYGQKLILNQLKELTGLVKKLERRIANLERKLAK